ncbi:MAG TPA: hypothetical protein VFV87_12990 [Pirellulaceae bacterium]|nr:hypothetical protein [Pirellulaceae bacterium]
MEADHRKSFRIVSPEGQDRAALRVGLRTYNVRVTDFSAGGYALACSEALPVCRGDLLRLRTSGGWQEVQVVRQERFSDGVLLGVERVREIEDPNPAGLVRSGWFDWFFPPDTMDPHGNFSGNTLRVAMLVGALLIAVVWLVVNYR